MFWVKSCDEIIINLLQLLLGSSYFDLRVLFYYRSHTDCYSDTKKNLIEITNWTSLRCVSITLPKFALEFMFLNSCRVLT